MGLSCDQIKRLLRIISDYELEEDIIWKAQDPNNITCLVNCNDLFHWGAADAERLKDEDDIFLLRSSLRDIYSYSPRGSRYYNTTTQGSSLYCARKRSMRPQGAVYKHIPECLWELFDNCGPERKVNFSNPIEKGD
jgi:hypothetical protein